ncbi:hypothetical protein KKP90_04980 [Methanothermococcus sp. SCGC AD-155-E23]|nr:hypothetical protein [Methanothermococcus sp. SCGC AD-155-E23]
MAKLTEKQGVLLLYGIAVFTGVALMLSLPRLGYDNFIFMALITLSIPLVIFAIGSLMLVKYLSYKRE